MYQHKCHLCGYRVDLATSERPVCPKCCTARKMGRPREIPMCAACRSDLIEVSGDRFACTGCNAKLVTKDQAVDRWREATGPERQREREKRLAEKEKKHEEVAALPTAVLAGSGDTIYSLDGSGWWRRCKEGDSGAVRAMIAGRTKRPIVGFVKPAKMVGGMSVAKLAELLK